MAKDLVKMMLWKGGAYHERLTDTQKRLRQKAQGNTQPPLMED